MTNYDIERISLTPAQKRVLVRLIIDGNLDKKTFLAMTPEERQDFLGEQFKFMVQQQAVMARKEART